MYLLRVVTLQYEGEVTPNAKMPTVLLPVAEPLNEAAVAAPPAATTQPEYVYLSRVVDVQVMALSEPKAKIPTVLFPAAEPSLDAVEAAVPALTTQPT